MGGGGGPQPAYLPPVSSSTPDWAALAQQHEREDRRRRMVKIGGAAAGVLVVGGLVAGALAVQKSGGDDGKKPSDTAASSLAISPVGPSALPSGATGSASASPSASATTPGTPSGGPTATKAAGTGPAVPAGPPRLDDRGGRYPVTLAASAVVGRTDGHNGPTLVLNSSPNGYGQAGSAVVDTSKSFTVSAMVRNNAPTGGRAVVTQGSDTYYSFFLGRDYWGTHNQWSFKVQTAAGGQDNTSVEALSKGNATTGQWTLLTGVYDASAKKIQLYVNGELAQTSDVKGIWQTGGPLQIGRVMWKSTWTDYWDGAISNVQVWTQALPAARVAQLSGSGGVSAGVPAYAAWLLP
ncbi:hypothetical protein GCM10010193_10410 [Kitasatospora atroaurantiaca]